MDEGEWGIDLWNYRKSVQGIVLGPLHNEDFWRRSDSLFARLRLAGRRQVGCAWVAEHDSGSALVGDPWKARRKYECERCDGFSAKCCHGQEFFGMRCE